MDSFFFFLLGYHFAQEPEQLRFCRCEGRTRATGGWDLGLQELRCQLKELMSYCIDVCHEARCTAAVVVCSKVAST